ncbi:16415_t:CDS:1, partial [Gigaspora rosea]
TLNKVIREYEAVLNAKINESKSVLIPLTTNARRFEAEEISSYKILREDETVTVLGYNLNIEGRLESGCWPKNIKRIKEIIEGMRGRNLSFRGKILIAKSLIISRIWY